MSLQHCCWSALYSFIAVSLSLCTWSSVLSACLLVQSEGSKNTLHPRPEQLQLTQANIPAGGDLQKRCAERRLGQHCSAPLTLVWDVRKASFPVLLQPFFTKAASVVRASCLERETHGVLISEGTNTGQHGWT